MGGVLLWFVVMVCMFCTAIWYSGNWIWDFVRFLFGYDFISD